MLHNLTTTVVIVIVSFVLGFGVSIYCNRKFKNPRHAIIAASLLGILDVTAAALGYVFVVNILGPMLFGILIYQSFWFYRKSKSLFDLVCLIVMVILLVVTLLPIFIA
jgi:zinc transporter ZupT